MTKTNMKQKKSFFTAQRLTTIGLLSAITVVMGTTPLGFIQLPTIKATTMQIPVVIGAILEGPVVGGILGLIFGLFSIFQNMTAPSALSFALINPLVSVVPRILIGVLAYYGYRIFRDRNQYLAVGTGAAIGSLVNTCGVMGMIYLLYVGEFAMNKGIDPAAAGGVIASVCLINGSIEAVFAVVISIPIIIAILKIKQKLKK